VWPLHTGLLIDGSETEKFLLKIWLKDETASMGRPDADVRRDWLVDINWLVKRGTHVAAPKMP